MIFFTSLVAVGGVFALVHYNNAGKKSAELSLLSPEEAASARTFNELANKDSDGDGLKDWEEALWKTDPHNPDSDGDGTPDGEEVKLGRNPTVAGPQDSLADHPLKPQNTGTSEPNLSETDKFARSVFSKYMTLKQGGVPMTANNQIGLVQNMLQDQSLELGARVYGKKDLKITDDSELSVKQYGNEMAHIIMTYSISSKDAAIIAANSINHSNPDEIAELDPIIKSYETMLGLFLKAKTPPSALNVHIALLNSLSDMLSTTKSMRALYTDPLLALKGFGHYGNALPIFVKTIEDLRDYFPRQKVVFLPNEEGHVFGMYKDQP